MYFTLLKTCNDHFKAILSLKTQFEKKMDIFCFFLIYTIT
jgi:hypothetical protein